MPKIQFRRIDSLFILRAELIELIGFSTIVPELVDEDRTRRYDAILNSLDSNGDDDALALYEAESGEEEGEGHADFARAAFSASITLAFELFRDFLVSELWAWFQDRDQTLSKKKQFGLEQGKIDDLVKYYAQGPEIDLTSLPGWSALEEIRLTRNAVVHNRGRYSWDYLERSRPPRFPSAIDERLTPPKDDQQAIVSLLEHLVNFEPLPLDADYIRSSIGHLLSFAQEVKSRIGTVRRQRLKPSQPAADKLAEALTAFEAHLQAREEERDTPDPIS